MDDNSWKLKPWSSLHNCRKLDISGNLLFSAAFTSYITLGRVGPCKSTKCHGLLETFELFHPEFTFRTFWVFGLFASKCYLSFQIKFYINIRIAIYICICILVLHTHVCAHVCMYVSVAPCVCFTFLSPDRMKATLENSHQSLQLVGAQ